MSLYGGYAFRHVYSLFKYFDNQWIWRTFERPQPVTHSYTTQEN